MSPIANFNAAIAGYGLEATAHIKAERNPHAIGRYSILANPQGGFFGRSAS